MRIKITTLMYLLVIPFTLSAQLSENTKGLGIGHYMPNIALSYSLNKATTNTDFKSFGGKLVIVDFWNIHCGSCIAAMPKLDSIQKQYKDKVQIILVTKNTEQEAEKLFNRIKLKVSNIPMVYSDHVFNSLFPHNEEPFHVWIDRDGVIRHFTRGHNTNARNIDDFLDGKQLKLSRMVANMDYNSSKSLLEEVTDRSKDKIVFSSILAKDMTEVSGGKGMNIILDSSGNSSTINLVNQDILTLFCIAYDGVVNPLGTKRRDLVREGRVSVEVKSPNFRKPPAEMYKLDGWKSSHIFSYEVKIPAKLATMFL